MSRKKIVIAVGALAACLVVSLLVSPLSNLVWSGFYKLGSFTEELYTSSSCKDGQIRLYEMVSMGGFDAGTQVNYALYLLNGEQERLVKYIQPSDFFKGGDRYMLSGSDTVVQKEDFADPINGDDGVNHVLIDVWVRSDTFTNQEYEIIRDCVKDSKSALDAAINEANRKLPEPHMFGNTEIQFSGVYYYNTSTEVIPVLKRKTAPAQSSAPAGGTFTGKYEPHVKFNEELGNVTCHTLVVMDGTTSTIEYFKSLVVSGNSVQSITQEGNLRINLPWNELPEELHSRLLSGKVVSLELLARDMKGTDAAPCTSFLTYSTSTPL